MSDSPITGIFLSQYGHVSSVSRLDAFDIESKSFPKKYDREKVCYKLNLIQPENTFWCIREYLRINCSNNDPEIVQLWKEIAVGECITYLKYRLEKAGFQFQAGDKTKEVFLKLLKNFSVSQIYYIIWCKVNDASRWYLEGGVSIQRAANSVIGACERYGENAQFYERELPQYHRPSDCPRSVLTRFFYYDVLKLGIQADGDMSDKQERLSETISSFLYRMLFFGSTTCPAHLGHPFPAERLFGDVFQEFSHFEQRQKYFLLSCKDTLSGVTSEFLAESHSGVSHGARRAK